MKPILNPSGEEGILKSFVHFSMQFTPYRSWLPCLPPLLNYHLLEGISLVSFLDPWSAEQRSPHPSPGFCTTVDKSPNYVMGYCFMSWAKPVESQLFSER